jgi:hypothetical protein
MQIDLHGEITCHYVAQLGDKHVIPVSDGSCVVGKLEFHPIARVITVKISVR